MQIPLELLEAAEREIAACPFKELACAAERLTNHYRAGCSSGRLFLDPAARLAYLAARMPATYAAIYRVLQELGSSQPASLVDIGAGPGTGGWVAAEIFPSLERIACIEPSQPMADIGERLAQAAPWRALKEAKWRRQMDAPEGDLFLLAYLLGEMKESQRLSLLKSIWPKAQTVAIVEPGTPAGFQRILAIREWALRHDAHLIAPCPHSDPCPMQKGWCHFPARVERTRLHKLLKGGTLGYEDEKFSYLIFGKIPSQVVGGRIVGNPKKSSGLVQFPLCQDGKIQEISISRKQENFRKAKDAAIGDFWM